MSPPADLDGLSAAALKALVVQLLDEVRALKQVVADQRAGIARLKGLKGPPSINPSLKPSGMEQASERKSPTGGSKRRGRGGKQMRRVAIEDQVLTAEVPAGSRFKGYQSFLIQDLVLRPVAIRYRRERWVTPDGRRGVAPLPSGIDGHFGPELRRFVLAQYHQGQVTVPRLVALLEAIGIEVSKRQVVRLLIGRKGVSSTKRATCCAPGWRRRPGSRSTTPAPATRPQTASVPRSATTASLGSARPDRKAGSISWSCCAPAMATT